MKYENQLIVWWSVMSILTIIIFWMMWYFINGSIPTLHEIQLSPQVEYGVPYWLSILLGPYYSFLFVVSLTLSDEENSRVFNTISCVMIVLCLVLGSSLVFGLTSDLVLDFGVTLMIGLVIGLILSLIINIFFSLCIGLIFGLIFGLELGLILGLGFGLIFGLISILNLKKIRTMWELIIRKKPSTSKNLKV